MTTMTLTAEQIQNLKEEYVEFKINEMTHEDMYAFIRDVLTMDVKSLNDEELKDEIDEYDENLYEVLVPYVKDEENSYEILQEFIHDRHANDWIDN